MIMNNLAKNNCQKNRSKGGLVLWRSKGKTVQIGDDIFITLLSTNDHSGARLRIQAPDNMKISRLDQID